MTEKKKTAKPTTGRRSAADIEARNKASVEGLIATYGPKGDGKKPTGGKKK